MNSSGLAHGSDRYYEVEVTNKGTLTGLVTIANLSCGDNDAIGCDVFENDMQQMDSNGEWGEGSDNYIAFDEGQQDYSDIAFTLVPGEKHYIYVNVWYEDVTNQPENLSANINLELTYEQAGLDENGIATPPFTGVLYRWSEKTVNIGDSLANIKKITDYNTLGKDFFLKHNVNNDLVESSEVCFIKDGLHCLIGGDNGTAFETNKAMLLSIFGESACWGGDSHVNCSDGSLQINASAEGWTEAVSSDYTFCQVDVDGSTFCGRSAD